MNLFPIETLTFQFHHRERTQRREHREEGKLIHRERNIAAASLRRPPSLPAAARAESTIAALAASTVAAVQRHRSCPRRQPRNPEQPRQFSSEMDTLSTDGEGSDTEDLLLNSTGSIGRLIS
ncbi:hypothetical protein PIB30_001053 [Stylosanthes scabra]|uniref:Uncharacterized protein n=1 Tax=Stylosanthes scabra TaxID=79078 RepID=A0ABU6T2B4_9FABA|nr:hypothetical protein [Stylosanthes scabra]